MRPLERAGLLDAWDDTRLEGGDEWAAEIDRALGRATAAVLLVSQDFLDSDFVCRRELPRVLAAAEAGALTLIPVFLGPSLAGDLEFPFTDRLSGAERRVKLTKYQGFGTPASPLSNRLERERAFAELARRLMELVGGGASGGAPARPAAAAASKPWNVPHRRNAFFTGREEVLEELHRALKKQGSAALGQAISGLGGIGKTQTAVEYAYRYRDEYSAVLWTRAETDAEIATGFAEIARLLELEERDAREQEAVVAAVRRWLERASGWLLVFDNADTPALVEPYLPRRARGRVLVTSRARDFGVLDVARPLRLAVLGPEEALSFLLERTGRQAASAGEKAAAAELARGLGFLPLALEQAAAYVAAIETRFADYLASYCARRLQLLEKGKPRQDHPESVAATWALNFEQVQATSPASADILRVSAFLAPDRIPLEVLREGRETLGEALSEALASSREEPLALDELLGALSRFSLIERDLDAGTFDVHRMVQAVMRHALDGAAERRWARRAVQALRRAYPKVEFRNWPACDRLRPHARAVAGTIVDLSLSFEEAGGLLNEAGLYAKQRALYSEAEPMLERAVAITEQALGPDHPSLGTCLNNLATLYSDQGRYEEAEPLVQRDMAITEQALGPDHPSLAVSLNNLAGLYRDQGRYEEAEPLVQRAVSIKEQALGPDHPSLAVSLNNLAELYREQNRYEEAEPLYQRSVAIREQALGPDHPSFATSLNNLALLYRAQDRFEEAESLYQRSVSIKEQALGPDHPALAASLNNLANLYRDQGRYEEAEPLYRRSLQIAEKALGVEHPNVATVRGHYALFREAVAKRDA